MPAWTALAVFGAVDVSGDVGPSTYMGRNCIDGLVVKLWLSRFLAVCLAQLWQLGSLAGSC